MVLVIMLVFGLISGLLYVLVVPLIVIGAIAGGDLLLFAGILMLLPAIAISVITSLLMPAAWVEYAVTGDLLKAINPISALRLAARNPLAYIGAVVATTCRDSAVHPGGAGRDHPLDDVRRICVGRIHIAWFYRQTNIADRSP